MKIDEIRIYAEVLEQGLDFKDYLLSIGVSAPIKNIYAKKHRGEFTQDDTVVDKIRKVKDVDILITSISDNKEFPMLLVEYSTAVPTDDHKMQRSDVYYWGAVFGVPMMKISPNSKGMNQEFGGGAKFTEETEIAISCKNNAIIYQVYWENEHNKDCLGVKEGRLSCIADSNEVKNILKNIIDCFSIADSFKEYFEILFADYMNSNKSILEAYSIDNVKNAISDSSRFQWFDDRLRVKINRFGHAMDPDRGILYFVNMLLGAKNVITEIQVNRSNNYNCRKGYATLFDSLSNQKILENYVKDIIRNGNVFTDENAIFILKTALNIDESLSFQKVGEHQYFISNEVLFNFLKTHSSISAKSIFFLSTELQLTDKKRDVICNIKWNLEPIKKFIGNMSSTKFGITNIEPLSISSLGEDIITFASVELYKRIQCSLLAVSYPGAQGDRCVLTGSGTTTKRTYVDIIAYKDSKEGVTVYLEECKKHFSDSYSDALKLKELKENNEKKDGLKKLFRKIIDISDFSNIYTSVAAKSSRNIPNFDVDYIFMFDIDNSDEIITKINYSVAVIDLNLADDFSALVNSEGKLKGIIETDKIYVIS